jgi:hypothetical protein
LPPRIELRKSCAGAALCREVKNSDFSSRQIWRASRIWLTPDLTAEVDDMITTRSWARLTIDSTIVDEGGQRAATNYVAQEFRVVLNIGFDRYLTVKLAWLISQTRA